MSLRLWRPAADDRDRAHRRGWLTPGALERYSEISPTNTDTTPAPATTVAGLVRFMCFHESYHIGQLGLLRRLNGKSGLA